MLSFQEKTRKSDSVLRIAHVKGPDFEPNSYVNFYEDPNKKDTHYEESLLACYKLKDDYDGQVKTIKNGVRILQGEPEILAETNAKGVGCFLQLYGLNKFTLCAERQPNQTQVVSLFGAPGSGKSTFIGRYMDSWKGVFPNGKILVFSRKQKEDEPEFKQDYQQIDVEDPEFLRQPIGINDIKKMQEREEDKVPVLCIYDDVSTFPRQIAAAIQSSQDDCIKVGRSFNVSVVSSNHVISDGVRTKTLHNASTHVVLSPNSNKVKVQTCLKDRFNFKEDLIDYLTNDCPTRWICVTNTVPQYVVTENMCATVNYLTDHFRKRK